MRGRRILLFASSLALIFTSNCSLISGSKEQQSSTSQLEADVNQGGSSIPGPDGHKWKSFSQLETDLNVIIDAGYTRACLFELKTIRDYPDPRYVSLLKKYADKGLEITIFAQQIEPSQDTLHIFQSMGASSVIIYEKDLLALFKQAGVKTFWWSGVAFPSNHKSRPQYMGWPDLRSEAVRQDIADWAVAKVPKEVDGELVLDYIRWNQVGDGRTAEQVTDLLQRIRTQRDKKDAGPLSATVRPYLGQDARHGGALSVGQRWNEWLENDLVDFVYPMAYASEGIPAYVKEWKSYDTHKIIPCLSVMDYAS